MRLLPLALLAAGCSSSPPLPGELGLPDGTRVDLASAWPDAIADRGALEGGQDRGGDRALADAAGPCPAGMTLIAAGALSPYCIDRHEAPGVAGELPLVMYTFVEAEAWCQARGKRLCFDDEWTLACAGLAGTKYPYGNTHQPGVCNDDKTWRAYQPSKLDSWPTSVATPAIATLADLLAAARAKGSAATASADHVEWLYQGTPSGTKTGCTQPWPAPVLDLCGNVEEWTRRRDGGRTSFHGNLKGRYWAEARTCQSGVLVHGDGFRFYEIGFRCCRDPQT